MSFKVIDVNRLKSSWHAHDYLQPFFHERLANNGTITSFTGVPLFDAFVRRFP